MIIFFVFFLAQNYQMIYLCGVNQSIGSKVMTFSTLSQEKTNKIFPIRLIDKGG